MRVGIFLGQVTAARESSLPAYGNMRVLAEEQGLEAAILKLLGQIDDVDGVGGGKEERAKLHACGSF